MLVALHVSIFDGLTFQQAKICAIDSCFTDYVRAWNSIVHDKWATAAEQMARKHFCHVFRLGDEEKRFRTFLIIGRYHLHMRFSSDRIYFVITSAEPKLLMRWHYTHQLVAIVK